MTAQKNIDLSEIRNAVGVSANDLVLRVYLGDSYTHIIVPDDDDMETLTDTQSHMIIAQALQGLGQSELHTTDPEDDAKTVPVWRLVDENKNDITSINGDGAVFLDLRQ